MNYKKKKNSEFTKLSFSDLSSNKPEISNIVFLYWKLFIMKYKISSKVNISDLKNFPKLQSKHMSRDP